MNKSLLQKKFRFVMVIAALALFITIFTPAYINYGSKSGYPKIIWMWTVLFGTGGGNYLNPLFNFSWFAFIGYAMAIILLIISFARKFVVVDNDKNNKSGFVVDVICMFCCLISLIMFIILPFSLTNGMSTEIAGAFAVKNIYGWGVSLILAYIILVVMLVSSFIALYAETLIKFKKIREKKANNKTVDNNKE